MRAAMKRGIPIRDASPDDDRGWFLNLERYLLKERDWKFFAGPDRWTPPKK
jgi:hypothetical protein